MKAEFIEVLEVAIKATILNQEWPGKWSVESGVDYIHLVWTCDAANARQMNDNEPWSKWGGNAIIKAAGVDEPNDSGIDAYTDKYGNDMVCQWVEWKIEEEDE